jgi:dTDP-4-amino-4,6-dideoxygalactose transaminase
MHVTRSTGSAPQDQGSLNPVSGVPLVDVKREYESLGSAIGEAIDAVLRSGQFVLGPACQKLEESIAAYCGARHAVGCASGSDALLLALMALDIGAGHEVIVPSYTFFATASAVTRLGAKPVFVDILPDTFNLDPAAVAAAVTPATRAIVPVHLFGQCAEMDAISEIAKRHSLTVVEDAAQAIGAEYRGRRAGTLSPIGCFSFYPTKNIGAAGDAGMLTTNDDALADRLQLLRGHGMRPRYYHREVGINSRLDGIQAAILSVKLPLLDQWTSLRQAHARRYAELIEEQGLADLVTAPASDPRDRHVWNQFVVRVEARHRDDLRAHLSQSKVGSEIYYPVPLHRQECFAGLGYRPGSLPHTEQAALETIALPIFPLLTAAEQDYVIASIAAFFGRRAKPSAAQSRQATTGGPHYLSRRSGSAQITPSGMSRGV